MSPRVDPTAGYESIVSGPLKFAGVDQGIDFTGTGSILAIADGVVEKVIHSGSGWPGRGALLVYRITAGPAKGKHVYVAEDYAIPAALTPGSKLHQGQVIGTVHSSYPGVEIGWANASGKPVAPLYPNPHSPKQAGRDFDAFVRGLAKAAGTAMAAPGTDATSAELSAAASSAGCATLLLTQLLAVGSAACIYWGTGAPWPW